MATIYPLPTLACTISAAGISAPPYTDILQSLQANFQAIYGSDAYIDPDSKDGQLLAILAKSISDNNDATIATYNSMSPSTAQGVALSNNVKLNGIARQEASNSSAAVVLVGQNGTLVSNGIISDINKRQWALPAVVSIGPTGQVTVTAVAVEQGAVEAAVGTLTGIVTPTLGWQSVTNPAEAAVGAPVEVDATLRRRQTTSTALNSRTVMEGIVGSLLELDGVQQVKGYENDTDSSDANGLPRHSISMVVLGGDVTAIAQTILRKKGEGVATYGSTVIPTTDSNGIPYNIRFYVPSDAAIAAAVTLRPKPGYVAAQAPQILAAIAAAINGLEIGDDVERTRLFGNAYSVANSNRFEIVDILIARSPAAPAAADVVVAFNERATASVADMTLTVVS